jgi:hypothetical protein
MDHLSLNFTDDAAALADNSSKRMYLNKELTPFTPDSAAHHIPSLDSFPQLAMLTTREKDQLLEGLRLNLRFELYQQMKSSFEMEVELFKEQFKKDQIE